MRGKGTRVARVVGVLGIGLMATLQGQIREREDRRPSRPSGRQPAVSLSAGPSAYDLGGSGTGFAAALRFDIPSGRRFIIEPGMGFLRYTGPTAARLNFMLPEISFQFSPSASSTRPYLGAGVGLAEFASGPAAGRGTVHAVAGLRLLLAGKFGVRAEGRYRIYDPLGSTGTMLDLGAGASWALGRE